MNTTRATQWSNSIIREDEVTPFLRDGRDFIDDDAIEGLIEKHRCPEKKQVLDILEQSLALQRLEPHQAAVLVNVTDEDL